MNKNYDIGDGPRNFQSGLVNVILSLTPQNLDEQHVKDAIRQYMPQALSSPEILTYIAEVVTKTVNMQLRMEGHEHDSASQAERIAQSVWRYVEPEITRILSILISESEGTVERIFKKAEYRELPVNIEADGSDVFEIPLKENEILEMRVQTPTTKSYGISVEVRPKGGELCTFGDAGHFFFGSWLRWPVHFCSPASNTYSFEFYNRNSTRATKTTIQYRIIESVN